MMSHCSTTGSPSLGRMDFQAPDADFLLHPWCCALQLLGKDRGWEQPGIKVIRSEQELNRAPLVVGVVTSCAPNGLGDLFLTLKDPSGTIGASVHKKVLSQKNIGQDISIGCVIVLSNVTIFRPSITACYLNVTKGKVIKVLRKDCYLPPKQDISSSTTQSQLPESERVEASCLGDKHMEWSAGTEISEETASIFSKMISRPKNNQVAGLLSGNVVCSSILRGDTSHSVGTHHGIRLVETNPDPPSKITPRYNTSHSINPDNDQQRHGAGSPMYGRGEGSTNNVMLRLLGGQRMMPSSKERTVAEVSRGHHGTLETSSSSSRMACASNSNTIGDHHKQWNILNTTCSQPNLVGSSVMSGDRYCSTQASAKQELRQPSANEWMLPSGKKLKSDAAVPDSNGKRASIRRPNEHQQMDIYAANAAAISGSLLANTKNFVSVASVAGWTDEQLSELFADH